MEKRPYNIRLILRKVYVCMRRIYISQCIKGRNISIISNNCMGAEISHNLGMRFNSPIVNLQIMPEDYIRFCSNLIYYMSEDIQECVDFTQHQRQLIKKEIATSNYGQAEFNNLKNLENYRKNRLWRNIFLFDDTEALLQKNISYNQTIREKYTVSHIPVSLSLMQENIILQRTI